jgi:hypothetical protein
LELAVKISELIRNLRFPQRCALPIRQLTGRIHAPIPPLEARVFLCGDQHSPPRGRKGGESKALISQHLSRAKKAQTRVK